MREKTSQSFPADVLIIEVVSTGKAIALLLIGGAIALAAYEFGRRSVPEPALVAARSEEPGRDAAPVAPPARLVEEAPIESGSTIDVPLGDALPPTPPSEAAAPAPAEPPTQPPMPPMPPIEERPSDEPGQCLSLEATPNSVSAYGASGPAVQLVVRARNRCATAFSGPSTYFRVVAAGANGFPFATATGRFAGPIPAFGTAETLVAITGDATRVVSYRAELR